MITWRSTRGSQDGVFQSILHAQGYVHGKVLCEFLTLFQSSRKSQRNAVTALCPSSATLLQLKPSLQLWFCSVLPWMFSHWIHFTLCVHTESKTNNRSVWWQILPKPDYFTWCNAMYCNQMPILTDIKINFIKKELLVIFRNTDVHIKQI